MQTIEKEEEKSTQNKESKIIFFPLKLKKTTAPGAVSIYLVLKVGGYYSFNIYK
jgi:hypothetical protein